MALKVYNGSVKYLFCGLTVVLVIIQIILAPKNSLLKQSEIDLIQQQQRMNEYPPRFYRLANILEKRPESRLIYKLENNFFSIFNIKSIWIVLIPFGIIGFLKLVKRHEYLFLAVILGLPILVLTLFGTNLNLGNFCLYPFLLISVVYGFISIFKEK